jgi:hypothetical protein
MSFSQKGPRSVCILSANGTISNVTLRQPGSSGSTFTYEVQTVKLSMVSFFQTKGTFNFDLCGIGRNDLKPPIQRRFISSVHVL